MMVRRYVVKDMPEAISLIRKDLGRDAVILSTKRITEKKWLGLWRAKRIEVVAATGDDVPLRASAEQVQRLLQPVPKFSAGPTASPALMRDARWSGTGQAPRLEAHLEPVYQRLIYHGVTDEAARQLLSGPPDKREATASGPDADTAQSVNGMGDSPSEWLARRLAEQLDGLVEPHPIAPTSRVVAFVGPTGVGKTTTVAKLAALHVLSGQRRVGLVTTDTFRIAAVEQLRTYADILGVPLKVVYRPDDFPEVLDQLTDRDLILIDTAGRNYCLDTYVEEAHQLLRAAPVDETYLVLSVAGKPQDLDTVARKLSALPVDKFLFTKLDETSTYGAILNLLMTYRKPVSYLTTGQNVPDDIEIASLQKIVQLILEGAA